MHDFRILEWDSDFFGFLVARILPEKMSISQLTQIITCLKNKNVKLAFWATNPDDNESQRAARMCHGYLADKKISYVTSTEHITEIHPSPNWKIEEYQEDYSCAELEQLATQAGTYSRFKRDPQIPEGKFVDLYTSWIRKSVNRQIADVVLVARHANLIVGFVTVKENDEYGNIGLFAVTPKMRRKNLGFALINAALDWSRKKGLRYVKVTTQKDNLASCKLYEKCGFIIDKIENFYHFWIRYENTIQ